jgi:hypothetical protein
MFIGFGSGTAKVIDLGQLGGRKKNDEKIVYYKISCTFAPA